MEGQCPRTVGIGKTEPFVWPLGQYRDVLRLAKRLADLTRPGFRLSGGQVPRVLNCASERWGGTHMDVCAARPGMAYARALPARGREQFGRAEFKSVQGGMLLSRTGRFAGSVICRYRLSAMSSHSVLEDIARLNGCLSPGS